MQQKKTPINLLEPEYTMPFSSLASLVQGLNSHIERQKKCFGDIELSRCEHVLAMYGGEDWKQYISYTEDGYTRYGIAMPEDIDDFDVYLVGWSEDKMSGIHDHADNGCIMKFLDGEITESRYEKKDESFTLLQESSYSAGDTAYVPGEIGFHAIGTVGRGTAVSLHVYSPAKFKTEFFNDPQVGKESKVQSINSEYLIDNTVSIIKKYIKSIESGDRKVIDFHQPEQLKELFDFSLPVGGSSDEKILESIQDVLDKSVATMHPRFFNQLYAGVNVYSTMAEWITSVLNTSMYTYEVGPLFTLMEEYVYEELAKLVGWKGVVDGMMLPGGSNSNLNALQMARYAHNPDIHESGLYGSKKLYVLTSDESHYSITKSVMLMGLGKDAVIKIPTNDAGQMKVEVLEEQIIKIRDEGGEIFMINATAGTTVLGAYDPINAIAVVGKKYDIRVHVDMIRGGTVLFDEELKNKISGIDLVDSFARNPHKMMGASMQCSVWMTQRPEIAATCNALKTQYLFADDKGYGVGCDTGDKYSQCGRRVDVLKLRLLRKSLGQEGIAANTRKAFADAEYMVEKVKDSDQLYLYQEPECTNICFWYIPSDIQLPGTSHQANLATIKANYHRIHTITAKIKDRMLEKGEMMVNYAHTKGYPNFFRMITISPVVKKEDLDFVVSDIVELGKEVK